MIAVYYNPTKDTYYAKFVKTAYFYDHYKVGYINQYRHILVCLFYIDDKGRLINCKSWYDYMHSKVSLKNKLINKLINWLERRCDK